MSGGGDGVTNSVRWIQVVWRGASCTTAKCTLEETVWRQKIGVGGKERELDGDDGFSSVILALALAVPRVLLESPLH